MFVSMATVGSKTSTHQTTTTTDGHTIYTQAFQDGIIPSVGTRGGRISKTLPSYFN